MIYPQTRHSSSATLLISVIFSVSPIQTPLSSCLLFHPVQLPLLKHEKKLFVSILFLCSHFITSRCILRVSLVRWSTQEAHPDESRKSKSASLLSPLKPKKLGVVVPFCCLPCPNSFCGLRCLLSNGFPGSDYSPCLPTSMLHAIVDSETIGRLIKNKLLLNQRFSFFTMGVSVCS